MAEMRETYRGRALEVHPAADVQPGTTRFVVLVDGVLLFERPRAGTIDGPRVVYFETIEGALCAARRFVRANGAS